MTNLTDVIRDLWRQFALLAIAMVLMVVLITAISQQWRNQLQDDDQNNVPLELPQSDWQESIAEIQQHSIFGRSMPSPTLTPEQLNIELKGIFMSDVPEHRKVVIQQSGEPEKLYAIGDTLGGMWQILDIERFEIMLGAGGKRYPLHLPEPKIKNTPVEDPLSNNDDDDDEQPEKPIHKPGSIIKLRSR